MSLLGDFVPVIAPATGLPNNAGLPGFADKFDLLNSEHPSQPALPALTPAASQLASESNSMLRDFYYRIWVYPDVLNALNPQYVTPIPFNVWNAYPTPPTNLLDSIVSTGADGLTFDGFETAFRSIEYRQVSISIGFDAPPGIDANFQFVFQQGIGLFRFTANISNILDIPIESGIIETYSWLTDILQNYDGSEQRIALRTRPRVSYDIKMLLLDDAERKRFQDSLYKASVGLYILPAYQNQGPLRAATVIGDDKIYCNTKAANLREGGFVLIRRRDSSLTIFKIVSVFATYVVIDQPHSEAIPTAGSVVMAGIQSRVPNPSGFKMRSISGEAQLKLNEFRPRAQLPHPLATVSLTTYQGLPVLERRPLADELGEEFDSGISIIDNDTGLPAQYSDWTQRYIQGERKYLINTRFSSTDYDYWMTFLEYARGQQKSFFTSTYREDLVFKTGGSFTSAEIEVEGLEYAQAYASSPTYAQIEIVTSIGTYWKTASSAVAGVDSTVITFDVPILESLTGVTVERISYLIRSRLGSDTVMIAHENTHAIISLSTRAVLV